MQLRRCHGGNEDRIGASPTLYDPYKAPRRSQRHLAYHRPKRKIISSANRQCILNVLLAVALLFQTLQVIKYQCLLQNSNANYAAKQRIAREIFNENVKASLRELEHLSGPDGERLDHNISHNEHSAPQNFFFVWKEGNKTIPLTEPPFEASEFNYSQPAISNNLTLSEPRRTQQSTAVIVLSARSNFEARTAIRESWAKGHDNVYFVIGGASPYDDDDVNRTSPNSTTNLLFQEQRDHGDLLDSIHPDSYKGLPYKVHFAFRWVSKMDHVKWVLKADDDVVVRIRALEREVLQQYNPEIPLVLGRIQTESWPHHRGKWAEDPKYTEETYPPWATGSSGYVVSRPIAAYIGHSQNLYYYQGEDAGLGVWLSQATDVNGTSGLGEVTFIDHPAFHKDESCSREYVVIGHGKKPKDIMDCFKQIGDEALSQRHVVYSTLKLHISGQDEDEEETLNPLFDTVES